MQGNSVDVFVGIATEDPGLLPAVTRIYAHRLPTQGLRIMLDYLRNLARSLS